MLSHNLSFFFNYFLKQFDTGAFYCGFAVHTNFIWCDTSLYYEDGEYILLVTDPVNLMAYFPHKISQIFTVLGSKCMARLSHLADDIIRSYIVLPKQ